MSFIESAYLNYFALTSITALVQWFAGMIFILSLPEKSKPAKILFSITVVSTLFAIGFVLSYTFYYPSVIPRILTISVMVLSNVLHAYFIANFPEFKHPRLTNIIFYFELAITALLILYLFLLVGKSPALVYDFEAHYFEIMIPDYFKLAGFVMLIVVAGFSTMCIWYAFLSKGNLRKAYALIFLAQIGMSIIPIPLSLMNRLGIISREFFMSYYCVTGIIGFFIFLTVFINNTNDRTSFLYKIISVSFLSFILIFNLISNLVLNDREKNYDELHIRLLNSIVHSEERPEDLRYILKYNVKNGNVEYLQRKFTNDLPLNLFQQEINIAYLSETIETKKYTPKEWNTFLENLQIKDNDFLQGYIAIIRNYLPDNSIEEISGTQIINWLRSKETFFYFRYNKIKALPDKDFRKKLLEFLAQEKKEFNPMKEAILKYLSMTGKEDSDLKKDILFFLLKFKNFSERKFRELDFDERIIAFHLKGKEEGDVYEVGFSYLDYRKFIHLLAVKLFYALMLGVVLILFGTPILLSGALVTPLNELMQALRKVRKGDLSISVPVKVQDEIGFLTGTFNMMVKSIREAKEKLEEYSEHLEQKVEERTNELQSTLNTVNVLKTQQDGDYFLTSLLLKPFIVNHGKSEIIDLEFLISQKKKFEFHGKKYEIGGDLCHTQNLSLNDKKYILFFNCDSMGKSLQGAGGAIVFGSVFFSIIERTNQSILMKDQSPERWIKNAFIELHKVFLTFDGSMLVSAIIGLIDEATGVLYYINAEHPWTVLYRDGKSDFIEKENYFSKLGSPINAKLLFVNVFQMKKGDVILIGSDGRDDFALPDSSEAKSVERNINFDETEFLRTVKQGEADLARIYELTSEKGVITDDYSLIRIEYKGEDYDGKELKSLAIKNYNQKKFEEALRYGLKYIDKCPGDTEFLFIIGHAYKMQKKYDKAAYYLERVRIRNPNHFRNLINLVQVHIELGSSKRAKEILSECERIDPDSNKLPKLRAMLID